MRACVCMCVRVCVHVCVCVCVNVCDMCAGAPAGASRGCASTYVGPVHASEEALKFGVHVEMRHDTHVGGSESLPKVAQIVLVGLYWGRGVV